MSFRKQRLGMTLAKRGRRLHRDDPAGGIASGAEAIQPAAKPRKREACQRQGHEQGAGDARPPESLILEEFYREPLKPSGLSASHSGKNSCPQVRQQQW